MQFSKLAGGADVVTRAAFNEYLGNALDDTTDSYEYELEDYNDLFAAVDDNDDDVLTWLEYIRYWNYRMTPPPTLREKFEAIVNIGASDEETPEAPEPEAPVVEGEGVAQVGEDDAAEEGPQDDTAVAEPEASFNVDQLIAWINDPTLNDQIELDESDADFDA
jgi:hypothetical protein